MEVHVSLTLSPVLGTLPPIELLLPVLIRQHLPCLNTFCFAAFNYCPLEVCSFLKEMEVQWIWGIWEVGEIGGVEREEITFGIYYVREETIFN